MKLSHRHKVSCSHIAYLHRLKFSPRSHKPNGISSLDMPLFHTTVYDNSLVLVIIAVENKSLKRSVLVALWAWYILYNTFKHLFDVRTHFS